MVFIRKTKIKGKTYLYLVTNKWIKGKVKQKYLAYIGKEEELPKLLQEILPLRKLIKYDIKNLSHSAPLELLKIANEIEIPKIITDKFPKEWGVDAGIASTLMILNYCFDSKSKNELSDWYDQTYLKHELKISSKKINRDLLYHTLDFFDEEKIEDLHKQIFQKAKEKYNLSNEITMYDVTALFFEGDKCELEKIIKENSQYIAGATKNNTIKKLILSINEKDFHPLDENNLYYEALSNPRTIIFWNKEIASIEKRERDKKLNRILKELSEINPKNYKKKKIRFIEKVGEIVGKYRKFFDIEYKNFSFKLKEDEIKKAEYLDGKCAIETNTNFLAGEILQRYRNRNIVEMSFKDLKMFVDIRPIRHWKEKRVLGHIFLAVLAFGLRSLLELKLRTAGLNMTAQEALENLSRIRVLCSNGKILRTTGETETTKKIQQIMSK